MLNASPASSGPLESQRALRRYEVMCGTPRRLPSRAWRSIAVRLEGAAQCVPPAYAARYADRAQDAWRRSAEILPPVTRVYYSAGQRCESYAPPRLIPAVDGASSCGATIALQPMALFALIAAV